VAKRYRTDHREVRLKADAVFDELPKVIAAMDQPTVDGLNIWCVSRAAREAGLRGGPVGIGGDEIFWGYRHIRFAGALAEACRLLSSLPAGARRRLARFAVGSARSFGLVSIGPPISRRRRRRARTCSSEAFSIRPR
jgi:asparagine synthase (glutamine-hydrolysing)